MLSLLAWDQLRYNDFDQAFYLGNTRVVSGAVVSNSNPPAGNLYYFNSVNNSLIVLPLNYVAGHPVLLYSYTTAAYSVRERSPDLPSVNFIKTEMESGFFNEEAQRRYGRSSQTGAVVLFSAHMNWVVVPGKRGERGGSSLSQYIGSIEWYNDITIASSHSDSPQLPVSVSLPNDFNLPPSTIPIPTGSINLSRSKTMGEITVKIRID